MPSNDQPKQPQHSKFSAAERKRTFLEEFKRTGDMETACRETGTTRRALRTWRDGDKRFRQAFYEIKDANARKAAPLSSTNVEKAGELPLAEKPATNLSVSDRRRIFLKEFAAIGALTLACDAAGVDLRTLNDWLQEERGFREAFNEAKLRYRDRLQSLAMRQITEERDGPMLRFTLQAEFPEKYGKPGKMSRDRPGLTWADLERMAGAARRLNDATASL